MRLICRCCGRDLNKIYQDNMSETNEPLCEDCYSEQLIDSLDLPSDMELYEGAMRSAKRTQKQVDALILAIAKKHLLAIEERGDFKRRYNDDDDFVMASVWCLESAFQEVFRAGMLDEYYRNRSKKK